MDVAGGGVARHISRCLFICGVVLLVFCFSSGASDSAYYWKSPIDVHSACSTASAGNIIDGDYNTLWHHWVDEAHWVILDLGESHTVSGIRQWHERQNDAEAAMAEIYVSENTTDWGTSLGNLGNTRGLDPGWIEADITQKQGRYVKLVSEYYYTLYWREVQVKVYGEPDATPPAAITDLAVSDIGSRSVILSWTATGDDGLDGTGFQYDLRYTQVEIDESNWVSATQVTGEPSPLPSGSLEEFAVEGLTIDTTYYFAIKVRDEMSNESDLSNVTSATTQYGTTTLDETDVYLDFIAGRHVDGSKTMHFRLFRPTQFDNGADYPLIVFLHWNGVQGDDNQRQIANSNHNYINGIRPWIDPENQAAHPAFILAPQCPLGDYWVDWPWGYGSYDLDAVPESDDLSYVVHIIDYLASTYRIDKDRIFVTGISMGGMGTWDLLLRHPDLFVAGMPVCGCGSPDHAANMQDIPVWNFHGAQDRIIPVQCSRDIVNALNAVDGDVQYTEYPDAGHDIGGLAYNELETIAWVYSYLDSIPFLNLEGTPANQAIHLAWSVNTSITGTWQIDYYSETVPSVVSHSGIASSTRAYTLTGLENGHWYTVTLTTVGVTPPLSDTVAVQLMDHFVYLPLITKEN